MRAALYARVSTEEQVEGYSIDAQRRAFREFCNQKEWAIAQEYVEEGRSAHTEGMSNRPVFKEAIQDALAKKYDVLVVHKIDRFSRRLRVTLEYFDKLHKAGVGFVSISEQMDFSTPTGQVFLAMVGAFSQFYSDNLSQETKKGWAERRAQGLYCGLLPFGAMKGDEGIPVAHPDTYPGLVTAFELSAQGKTDREVAQALNAGGYRTAGNHGPRPFSKETVKDMLRNRFYLGELPDGNGGWIDGKHQPFVSPELFHAAQQARERRRHHHLDSIRSKASTFSLSGLTWCAACGSKVHIHRDRQGKPRTFCYGRAQGNGCDGKGTFLEVYERQIEWYLEHFRIPEDYQQRILDAFRKMQGAEQGSVHKRKQLEARLGRLKELYGWGHLQREDYLSEYEAVHRELEALKPETDRARHLERLAHFLKDVAAAWRDADHGQRNKLASAIFQQVWVKDNRVIGVRPLPELEPFFRLNHEGDKSGGSDGPSSTWSPESPRGRQFIILVDKVLVV